MFNLCVWRHPKPVGANGRCIGRTDLPVDRRKAKRLAHRIRQHARRHRWPRVIHTSDLQRCLCVGRQLRRWGWRHHVHPDLAEMDFGHWEGRLWQDIDRDEFDAWCADFLHARPGQGEALSTLFDRLAQWARNHASDAAPALVVSHAGCMQAWAWMAKGGALPQTAAQWSVAPRYGVCWYLALWAPPAEGTTSINNVR